MIVDCTLGGAGHASALLKVFPQAELLGLDRDAEAVKAAGEKLAPYGNQVLIRQLPFSEVTGQILSGSVDYLLADLGVSSHQLEQAERGFSFLRSGPLDMRMDAGANKKTAAHLVHTASEDLLKEVLYQFGEERHTKRIVAAILSARSEGKITTTGELAKIVSEAVPRKFHKKGHHPATKTFQALRMALNDEMGELEGLLTVALDLLAPGGRVAIITFHSLEDRAVKQAFLQWENPCTCPPNWPVCVCGKTSLGKRLTRKPVCPDEEEIARNPRSRSAKLRVFEKNT